MSENSEKLQNTQNILFIYVFPSIFIIILLLIGIKDLYDMIKFGKKNMKKFYKLFFVFFLFFLALGIVISFIVISDKVVDEKLNEKTFSKCYNNKLEEEKKKITEECKKK